MKNLRYNSICLRVLAFLCLILVGGSSASGQTYYVFQNETYGYLVNNGTNNVGLNKTFSPAAVWIANGTLGTTSRNIRSYTDESKYMNGTTDGAFTLGNSSNVWRMANNYLQYRNGSSYYVKYSGSAFTMNNTQNNGNRFTAYAVTISDAPASLTAPTISGGTSVMSATGSTTFSHSNSTYTPQRTNYRFNNADHYVNGTSATVSYSWALSDMAGYATVSNAGVVTYSTLIPERERTATLTCTATAGGLTQTATTTIKFVNPNVLFDPSISYGNAAGGRVSVTLSYPESDSEVKLYYTTNGDAPSSSSTEYTGPFEVASPTTIKVIAVKGSTTSSVVSMVVENITPGVSGGKVVLDDREDHNWTLFQPTINGEDNPIYYANPKDVKITYKANGGAVSISESANQFVYYKTLTDDYKYTTIPNPFSKRPRANGNYQGFSKWKITRISGGTITGLAVNSEVNAETELTFNPTSEYGMEVDFEVVWTRAYVVECAVGSVNSNLNSSTLAGDSYETNFIVITSGTNSTTNLTAATSKKVTITMVTPDGATDYRTNTRYIRPQTITLSNDWKFEYINMNDNGTTITANNHDLVLGRGISNTSATGVVAGTLRGVSAATNNDLIYHIRMESGRYTNVDATMQGDNTQFGGTQTIRMTVGCDYDRANNEDNTKLYITDRFYGGNSVYFTNAVNKSRETLRYTVKSGTIHTSTDMSSTVNGQFYFGIAGWTRYSGKRTLIIEGGNFHSISGGLDYDGNNGNNSYAGIVTSQYANADDVMVEIQMRGGTVRGSIYGAAQFAAGKGIRKYVFTGGTINGWVAGGCNGTNTTGGQTYGSTQIYVGGNNHVVASNANPQINSSYGGNVFGAGSGINGGTTVGQVNNSTLVVADHSIVGGNVFGGGNYGYVMTDGTDKTGSTKIYVTGGTVRGQVYGGSNQQQGQRVNITMTGGTVEGGIYGGSNVTGTINNSVTMQINGGQVGTSTTPGNIHGGGYGQNTVVSQNVDITLGKTGAARDADGVTVWGDVYGGSALGKVNGEAATNTYHTNVTMNAGYIHGSLYGGALGAAGTAANVYGPVQVKVYGGSVFNTDGTGANGSGAVYGANNINGAPQRSVTVDIYGTNSAPAKGEYALFSVYGGGNQANYTYGNGYPKVTVHNCDNSIEYVYGGGNAAAVAATDVTIYGGNKIGNVFGGGNGQVRAANVNGNTSVKIYGGTIGDVYGGSNTQGTIGGTINVTVNKTAEDGGDGCDMKIDNVYGGGNKAASNVGNVTIQCTGTKDGEGIGAVYGGANQADITGNINLRINSGTIKNVFGGNNTSGTISGTITVTVNEDTSAGCGKAMEVGNVYGGGNKAAYTGNPTVNFINGTSTGSVFGGGLGQTAIVTGNPQVNIGSWTEGTVTIGQDVFGGGDLAAVEGAPVVTIRDCGTIIKRNLYGGGNAAPVHATNTTMWGGYVWGNVFGGGNGEDPTKNANGAQVGFKSDDATAAGTGQAVTNIFGGTIGTWTDGVCATNTGGIFGGSNTNGNIRGGIEMTVDGRKSSETGASQCDILFKEIYGAGNLAAYMGSGITFNLGCVENMDEVYGGAKQADLKANVTLNLTSGHIKKVFGGNNISGALDGTITVNIDETGCFPVKIDNLYLGGNQAAYSVFGYNTDGTVKTTGDAKADPVLNIVSCTNIGRVFGGGLGETATIVGNPVVNVNLIPGEFAANIDANGDGNPDGNANAVGTIATIFGGGDAAPVQGNTTINIGTATTAKHITGADQTTDHAVTNAISGDVFGGGLGATAIVHGSTTVKIQGDTNVEGNVYGGGNAAEVEGTTNVQIGEECP